MAEEEGAEKTQAASAARLSRAQAEGNAPLSRELPLLAGLGAAVLVLVMAGPGIAAGAATALAGLLRESGAVDSPAVLAAACKGAALIAARAALPVALAALAGGLFATLAQTGGALRLASLGFDLSHVSPAAGLGRLVSADQLATVVKSLLKLGVMGAALAAVLIAAAPAAAAVLALPVPALAGAIAGHARAVVLPLLGVQAAIAAGDIALTRFRFAQSLRMSREDVKEEAKSAEGDPHVRARRRAMRLALRRTMMARAMQGATVVITNPTHYAVALAYRRGAERAPVVVAKGTDGVAARIRALAAENRVPLFASPPLARALHKVEIDAEIPAEHFKAVAEIIAYVWRLEAEARSRRVA